MVTRTQLARLGLFDVKVPRYTSYPTAPHFAGAVGPGDAQDWIKAIPQGAQISLYVHVPFCRRLCWFCACRTQGTHSLSPVAAYLETLKAELALVARSLPDGVTLGRLHWGGGTPTLMSPEMISDLAGAIFDVAPLAPGAEFSVEIDPIELDQHRLDALIAAGMNRASIGVQDFDGEVQQAIGRVQSFEATRDVVCMIRDGGVTSLNADILYGLPNQTRARITASVQKLLVLSPDRVALYGYAHVPWMARRQQMIPADALPDTTERLALFETARRLLLWDDYTQIGIDHFALPGDALVSAQRKRTLRRNFQGYNDDASQVLIGIGASAISRYPQGYAQNAPATSTYVRAIREGGFSTAHGHAFTATDRLHARMIEMVMCDFAIDAAEILRDHKISQAALTALFEQVNARFEGMLQITEAGLSVPPQARALTRMIARGFDAYDLSDAGHSSAV